MKRRKSKPTPVTERKIKVKKEESTVSKDQKTIKQFFTPCERPSFNNFFKKDDSDDDIFIIDPVFNESSFNASSSTNIKNVRPFSSFGCENSIISSSSKSSRSSSNKSPKKSPKKSTSSNKSSIRSINESSKESQSNSCSFQTPIKDQIDSPFDRSSPSPYFKKLSDTVNNTSFKEINNYLDTHLEAIKKVRTPIKSELKRSAKMSTFQTDVSSIKKELSFSDSPTKSDTVKDQKLDLTNKQELTYSEINRNNFNKILNKIIDDSLNRSLFNDEDLNLISIYTNLSGECQSLFIRLFFR